MINGNIALVIIIIFFGIIVYILYSLIKFFKEIRRTKKYIKTEGICKSSEKFIVRKKGNNSFLAERPIISYTVDNREYTIKSEVFYSAIWRKGSGTKYTVYYNPANPEDAILENKRYFYLTAFCIGLLAFIGLIMSFRSLFAIYEYKYNVYYKCKTDLGETKYNTSTWAKNEKEAIENTQSEETVKSLNCTCMKTEKIYYMYRRVQNVGIWDYFQNMMN